MIDDELIHDVLPPSSGSRAARKPRCTAAAAVYTPRPSWSRQGYKPQQFRAFRNDSVYQEGRVILDRRWARAAAKRTRHGRQVQASLWTNSEFETLRVLHRAGASVPRPIGQSSGAIAMEWIGDGDAPAPQTQRRPPRSGSGPGRVRAAHAQYRAVAGVQRRARRPVGVQRLVGPERARVVAIDFPGERPAGQRQRGDAAVSRRRERVSPLRALGVNAAADALAATWERFAYGEL